jgi:hypothetical protein
MRKKENFSEINFSWMHEALLANKLGSHNFVLFSKVEGSEKGSLN